MAGSQPPSDPGFAETGVSDDLIDPRFVMVPYEAGSISIGGSGWTDRRTGLSFKVETRRREDGGAEHLTVYSDKMPRSLVVSAKLYCIASEIHGDRTHLTYQVSRAEMLKRIAGWRRSAAAFEPDRHFARIDRLARLIDATGPDLTNRVPRAELPHRFENLLGAAPEWEAAERLVAEQGGEDGFVALCLAGAIACHVDLFVPDEGRPAVKLYKRQAQSVEFELLE